MAWDDDRERDRNRRRRHAPDRERGPWERAGDEVRSWFGDEEAERRRDRDEYMRGRYWGSGEDYEERTPGRPWSRDERLSSYGGNYGDRGDERGPSGPQDYPGDYYNRGYGGFGRGFGLGQGAGMGPGRALPFGPDYGTDARNIGYGGPGSDLPAGQWGRRGRHVRGPHSGRGPSGYRRSPERIVEDVNDYLTHHGHIDATNIRVSADDGEVTLEGTVDSRRAKRLAEDIAEDVRGVEDVHNRLRIVRADEADEV